jgi:hypothetical protein
LIRPVAGSIAVQSLDASHVLAPVLAAHRQHDQQDRQFGGDADCMPCVVQVLIGMRPARACDRGTSRRWRPARSPRAATVRSGRRAAAAQITTPQPATVAHEVDDDQLQPLPDSRA